MPIKFDENRKRFILTAKNTSYQIQLSGSGYLFHSYWGKKVRNLNTDGYALRAERIADVSPVTDLNDRTFSLDTIPLEFPAYGNSDYRTPAFQVQIDDGSTITAPKYKSHKITKGKPSLEGLPATYAENEDEAETLEIVLEDKVCGLEIHLLYTAFRDLDVIARSAKFVNTGDKNISILKALSMSVDMPNEDYEMLQLSGAWGRERHIFKRRLVPGMQSIESTRGASSHQQNPFVAILSEGTDETHGSVYAVNLVYSGSFFAGVEVDQYSSLRLMAGINPFDFSWLLEPGQAFQTPEAVMVYSDCGLGGMSRTFHKLYRERLCRGSFRDKERPILLNNWEATLMDFDSRKIINLAKIAGTLGFELFVLDDGWFGKRDDDTSSLGDWYVNKRKIPEGLDGLASAINREGMKFGLWVEPEMINMDSDLYRAHPDWCVHVEGRDRTQTRNQLVLDFSRPEVCNAIEEMLTKVISSAPICYIKWDKNRYLTETGSAALPPERQRETAHRCVLGLYSMLEKLTNKFPNVLFESCASGGGRFDPGMLYYMPQTWTSDDTDAVERLKIQYGTSLAYPVSSIASHVSIVPNQQVNRTTPLETRANVSMSANFGYEIDLNKLSENELEMVKSQIAEYKEIRKLVQFGDLYRLKSPFEGNETAWIYVSADKSEAFAAWFSVLGTPNTSYNWIKFDGLDPEADYYEIKTGQKYGGDELINIGLPTPLADSDFQSHTWRFKKVN